MPEQVAVIRWEEPPPAKRRGPNVQGHSRYSDIADQLRANPGRWAVIHEGPTTSGSALATHIRMGHTLCFAPAGDFDATLRRVDGRGLVYARYVGDIEES